MGGGLRSLINGCPKAYHGAEGLRSLIGGGGAVFSLSHPDCLRSLSAASPLIILSRVRTDQSGRGPRLGKHGIPCCWLVVNLRCKVGAHTRDMKTDRETS